ncbi:MAG TPA: preprotein translocase subunit YajC [Myxococcales bacterium]|nr:preprotein translocase subunit YajC [Myxococcales bacterium]
MPAVLLLAQLDSQSPFAAIGQNPLILISIFFVIFYVMIIRPQQKTAKKLEAYLTGLKKGDEVVTTGGLIGRIAFVTGEVLTLEVANNVKVRVLKAQVTGPFVPKEEKPVAGEAKAAGPDEAKK